MSNYVDYDNAVELFTEVGNKRKASESMQESLLKSTVGWTGKNLLPNNAKNQTINGVTFTVNADGSVTANGTATDNAFFVIYPNTATNEYENNILTGCPAGGNPSTSYCISARVGLQSDDTYVRSTDDSGNGAVIPKVNTSTECIRFYIRIAKDYTANNLTFYPMLRDASITDDTYEPYHESVEEVVEQIYADNGVLGAKNLWDESHSFNTKTGVTYTLTDHIYTINTAAEDYSGIYIGKTVARQYYSNYVGVRAKMVFEIKGDGTFNVQTLNNVVTSVSTEYKRVKIPISDLSQIDDIVFYNRTSTAHTITVKNLMIVLASDPDDTYVPYAMTNRELTEDTQELKYRVGILSAKVPYYVANATMPRKKTLSSAELTEARARAAEQDYKTVVPGDIIIGPNTGSEYYLAKCWGRKGIGDSQPTGGAALTPNLMLMLYKPHGITRLWAGYGNANKSWRVSANDLGRCPWNAAVDVDPTDSEAIGDNNTNITRAYDDNGTSVNVSGYMGSFIRKMLDERLLVDCFEADFGAANILPYRSMLGNAIKTDSPSGGHPAWNGLTNGWAWYTRKLDLPSEIELYGSIIWSSSGFDVGIQNEQLPFLKLGDIDLFFPRFDIWTKGVASGSSAAARYDIGYAGNVYASSAYWACPLACVK